MPFTIGGGDPRRSPTRRRCSTPAPTRSSVNSAAVARPELIGELAECFGAQCVVLAIDAKRAAERRLGGRTSPAAARRPAATRWRGRARAPSAGAGEILLTSMDRDGTQDGYDLELTRAIAEAVECR